MKIYINAISAISPQNTFKQNKLPESLIDYKADYLQVIPPEYKQYIPPKELRRMSKLMKIGLIAGLEIVNNNNVENLSSIIVSSGTGNVEDRLKFLTNIVENNERMLIPTSFAQSTSNVIAGLLALKLKNNNYNLAYYHDNVAFESALIDAIMQFQTKNANSVLVGGVDVTYEKDYDIKKTAKLFKTNCSPSEMYNYSQTGVLPGESACFFLLEKQKTENTFAQLLDANIIYKADKQTLVEKLNLFLAKNNLTQKDIDVVLGGYNGDYKYDSDIDDFFNTALPDSVKLQYKHLCGEHFTSSAFAFWIASNILKNQYIPEYLLRNKNQNIATIKNILISQNNFLNNKNHGFILLSLDNMFINTP